MTSEPDEARQSGPRAQRDPSIALKPRQPKRASMLADMIEIEIRERRWPVGHLVGSEPELISRYGVSRAVFREAIRLLEQREVALMRRGPGGGLIVTAPEESVVRRAAATLLRFEDVGLPELIEARVDLELACLELAVRRVDESGISYLRQLVEDEAALINNAGTTNQLRNFHVELASLSQNRPLWLFVSILTDLQAEFSPPAIGASKVGVSRNVSPSAAENSHSAHAAIAEAVARGDLAVAVHRMRRHLAAISTFSHEYLNSTQPPEPESHADSRLLRT